MLLPIHSSKCLQRILDLPGHHFLSYSPALQPPFLLHLSMLCSLASCLLFSLCVFPILGSALMISRASSWSHWRDGGRLLLLSSGPNYRHILLLANHENDDTPEFNKIKQSLFGYSNVARVEIDGLIPGPVLSLYLVVYTRTPKYQMLRVQGYIIGIHHS